MLQNIRSGSWFTIFLTITLCVSIFLGTLHFFRSDILYHTDIARDFLLVQEMVDEKKIFLIGGKTSIPGVFHGPLYYWMMLPFFMISDGNPLVVSILWLLLYWSFLAAAYYISKKLADTSFALITTALLATLTAYLPFGFTHTTVANFLTLPLVYFIWMYKKTSNWLFLAITVFTAGLLIQFQMGFGISISLILCVYLVYQILKNKQYKHLLLGFIICIPLSTFFIFDVRHEFAQTKSAMAYMGGGNSTGSLTAHLSARLFEFSGSFRLIDGSLDQDQKPISVLVLVSLVWLFMQRSILKKDPREMLTIAMVFIFGFWIALLFYKGALWSHYYEPLLPLVVLGVSYFFILCFSQKNWITNYSNNYWYKHLL